VLRRDLERRGVPLDIGDPNPNIPNVKIEEERWNEWALAATSYLARRGIMPKTEACAGVIVLSVGGRVLARGWLREPTYAACSASCRITVSMLSLPDTQTYELEFDDVWISQRVDDGWAVDLARADVIEFDYALAEGICKICMQPGKWLLKHNQCNHMAHRACSMTTHVGARHRCMACDPEALVGFPRLPSPSALQWSVASQMRVHQHNGWWFNPL
jgi:hypothetical protein